MYVCSIGSDEVQPIPHNTWTPLTFNVEYSDPLGMHRPESAFITCLQSGWYTLWAHVVWEDGPTAQLLTRFNRTSVNGPTATIDRESTPGKDYLNNSWPLHLTEGVKTFVEVLQTSGSSLDVTFCEFKVLSMGA